jgi:hypothetical protein
MLDHDLAAEILEDLDRLGDDLGVESRGEDQVLGRRVVLRRAEGQDLRVVLAERETRAKLTQRRPCRVGGSESRSEDLH